MRDKIDIYRRVLVTASPDKNGLVRAFEFERTEDGSVEIRCVELGNNSRHLIHISKLPLEEWARVIGEVSGDDNS